MEQLEALLERHSKATLGQLLKALRQRVELHPTFDDQLARFLQYRNVIAHRLGVGLLGHPRRCTHGQAGQRMHALDDDTSKKLPAIQDGETYTPEYQLRSHRKGG